MTSSRRKLLAQTAVQVAYLRLRNIADLNARIDRVITFQVVQPDCAAGLFHLVKSGWIVVGFSGEWHWVDTFPGELYADAMACYDRQVEKLAVSG